jgi:autotransporter passenger strand-loop-strand repeat protein
MGSGTQYVQGGTASATTIDSGGVAYLESGEMDFAVVSNGGTLVVSGGIASGATISQGGTASILGGTLSNNIVASGGSEIVSGGAQFGTQIEAGGYVQVFTSLSEAGLVVSSGGALEVFSGGAISGAVVSAGGILVLQSGAVADGTALAAGGYLISLPGAAQNATSGGGDVVSTGVVLINSGFSVTLNPSGPVTDSTIEFVLPGGTANATTVANGSQDVFAGLVSGTVISSGGAQYIYGGTASGDIISSGGSVSVQGGSLTNATIAGGMLVVDDGVGATAVSGGVEFSGTGGALQLTSGFTLTATISSFAQGDTVDLASLSFAAGATAVLSGGNLDVVDGGINLSFAVANVGAGNFTLQSDGAGGTDIFLAPVCYLAGTRVLTARGDIAVEALRIGDELPTLHAGPQRVKWIGRRAYAAPFCNHRDVLPICIKAGAVEEGVPARDLYVSPGHALCLDGVLVHARRLVNGVSVFQSGPMDMVEYFHIELDTHEIVFAENCPAETFVDESFRPRFQNAAEFYALYPGETAEPKPCLPRLESGFALLALQQRIAARAGVFAPAALGRLRGYVDQMDGTRISGWAQHVLAPEFAVTLDVYAGSIRLGRVLADLYRADVYEEGFGSGYHGFEFLLAPGVTGDIEVRRASDGAVLALAAGGLAA